MNDIVTFLIAILPVLLSLLMVWQVKRELSFFKGIAFNFSELFRYETEKDEDGKDQVLMDPRLIGIVDALGSRVAQSLKMSFLGQLSGQARLEKGLQSAIGKDIIDKKMPLLNLLEPVLGINVKDYLAENPGALMQLLPMLRGFLGHASSHNSSGSGGVGYQ